MIGLLFLLLLSLGYSGITCVFCLTCMLHACHCLPWANQGLQHGCAWPCHLPALGYSGMFCLACVDMHALGRPLLALGYQGL